MGSGGSWWRLYRGDQEPGMRAKVARGEGGRVRLELESDSVGGRGRPRQVGPACRRQREGGEERRGGVDREREAVGSAWAKRVGPRRREKEKGEGELGWGARGERKRKEREKREKREIGPGQKKEREGKQRKKRKVFEIKGEAQFN
jgi:hypothetical protein